MSEAAAPVEIVVPEPPLSEPSAPGMPASETPASSGDGIAVCPNCETPTSGRHCPECGQYQFRSRLTLRRLWAEFSSRVFNLDRGFLGTLWGLTRDPGQVPLDYVEGRRRRYTNPLSYLLMACAVSLFMLQFSEDVLREQMAAGIASQEAAREAEAAESGVPHDHDGDGVRDHDPDEEELRVERFRASLDRFFADGGVVYVEHITANIRKYQTPLMLLLVIPYALFLRLLFGPVRNLAEITVFSLYVVAHAILLLAFLMPFLVRMGIVATMLGTVLYFALGAWAAVRFWDEGWSAALRSLVAMTFAQGAYFVVVVVFAMTVTFGAILEESEVSWGWFLSRLTHNLFS